MAAELLCPSRAQGPENGGDDVDAESEATTREVGVPGGGTGPTPHAAAIQGQRRGHAAPCWHPPAGAGPNGPVTPGSACRFGFTRAIESLHSQIIDEAAQHLANQAMDTGPP